MSDRHLVLQLSLPWFEQDFAAVLRSIVGFIDRSLPKRSALLLCYYLTYMKDGTYL